MAVAQFATAMPECNVSAKPRIGLEFALLFLTILKYY
jgi:hypothetical protein